MSNILSIQNHYGHDIMLHANFSWDKNLPPKVLVLCHGFLSSIDKPPIQGLFQLLGKQTPVVTFDFIGNNEQIPTYSHCIDDLFDVVTHLHSHGVQAISLAGHSMGGVICLLTTTLKLSHTRSIDKLILISMPYDIRGFRNRYRIPTFKPHEEYKYLHMNGQKHRISKSFIEDIYIYDVSRGLKALRIPTLVIQGNKDSIISLTDAQNIYADIFGNATRLRRRKVKKIIPGGGHLFKGKKILHSVALEIEAFLLRKYPSV